jgi:hypothetical protein
MSTLHEDRTHGKQHARWQGKKNGTEDTGSEKVSEQAGELHALGYVPLPASEDGEKHAHWDAGKWSEYRDNPEKRTQLLQLFQKRRQGIFLLTGTEIIRETSEGPTVYYFLVIDFDTWDVWLAFLDLTKASGLGDLVKRIYHGWADKSPRGLHLHCLCSQVFKSNALAQRYELDTEGKKIIDDKGKAKVKSLIDIKAHGGGVVVSPSYGRVHRSGLPYTREMGGPATIEIVTPEEFKDLSNCARMFHEVEEKKREEETPHYTSTPNGERPGDIFNARGTWEEALPSGWVRVYQKNSTTGWRRSGKDRGISATTNHAGSDLFYCFSTSTSFESERGYSKFGVYALSHHHGDWGAAALALAMKGYTSNGNGHAHTFDMGEDDQETEEEENDRILKEERPVEDKWPCPAHLWRGPFARVAEAMGKQTWEVWVAVLVALGAKAHRNIAYKYHRMLYGMVYALLIKGTGMGKGLSTDLCRGLMPDWYVIRDAVQSGPALAPLLADIVRGQKGKVESCTPHQALLLIEEFTVLLKNAGIQHSTLIDSLNSLFHRPWPWNISRSDRPNSGGGDVVIKDPTLSILATTTEALFKEYVSPQMIRSGFLNRFVVFPGDSTPWKFYDPEGAGNIIHQNLGLFDHIPIRKVGDGQTVWQAYEPHALERIKSWGEETFEPIMRSSELEAESVKRMHVYAHVIGLLYAWGDQRPLVTLDDVECSITAIETSQQFLHALITEDREPEVPKFKAYEINLEQRILAKVKEQPGIRRRKVVQKLAGKTATSPDINLLITKIAGAGIIDEVIDGKAHKLYLPEQNPERKRKQ